MHLKFWGVEINMPPIVAIILVCCLASAVAAIASAFGAK